MEMRGEGRERGDGCEGLGGERSKERSLSLKGV